MRATVCLTAAFFCLSLVAAEASLGAGAGRPAPIKALVYHETTGFRHASIPYAIQQITAWGGRRGIEVTADQTSNRFTDAGLAPFDVVVWLSTVGGVRGDAPLLTDAEWAAFQRYMEHGGGYAGIHAASDCCDESAWYGELLGNQARFANHPGGVGGSPGCMGNFPGDPNVVRNTGSCFQATIVTEDAEHPTTEGLPQPWDISDELYNFKANPRSTVHVLQTLDESSYNFQPHPYIRNWGTLMGADHPITWCQVYDGGRVWYTGIGHDAAAFANNDSMDMIGKGISWAGGRWGLKGCEQEG
jgi:type 1 glutamine amidotransferase